MKIAFFVEGLSERIFIDALLRQYFFPGRIQIISVELRGHTEKIFFRVANDTGAQYAEHLCLIVDVGSDETVLSRLRENYLRMRDKGFEVFLGLRDLKSKAFDEFGEAIVARSQAVVEGFREADDVFLHFAKMTIEAWFLAAPSTFEGVHPALTVAAIRERTGMNLGAIDPETAIPNPVSFLQRVYDICGLKYRKTKKQIHRIVSVIDWEQLCVEARDRGKVSFFFRMLDRLEAVIGT
jgi:hypothetical protein